jgi:Family of unknown function (DUF5302)
MAADHTKPADAARPAGDGTSQAADGQPGAAAQSGAAPKSGAAATSGAAAKSGKAAKPAKASKTRAAGSPDDDDMKAKFRAALDRKRGEHAAANAEGAQDTGKVHGAHGPAASRRSFRRKSGG